MTIQFQHPLNGFTGFDPNIEDHYKNLINVSGIYIYGLRLNITEKKDKKFVPLYVGIANDLKKRLFNDHYNHLKSNGSGNKDLWDFSANSFSESDLYEKYADMCRYDFINNYLSKKRNRTSFNYMNELCYLDSLLFFQNLNFFNAKFGHPHNIVKRNVNQRNITTFFNNAHINKIIDTKAKFQTDFYFVYTTLSDVTKTILSDNSLYDETQSYIWSNGNANGSGKNVAERVELATKKALNHIGIHTTAKAKGEFFSMDVDLTQISSELINIGNHPFNYSNLIIKMKK
jgi:hypothetical protein